MGSPGVVGVTTFSRPDQQHNGKPLAYADYLDYKKRPNAAKKKHETEEERIYAEYVDYMGNPDKSLGLDMGEPEKITGLFTRQADSLDTEELKNLKETYALAQANGSLMWKTVFSFDNPWLAQMGVYNEKTGILDEKRMRNVTRKAVGKLLEEEDLKNGVWSASIHYNTDNIHVHISIVEPTPMRRKKVYKQYEVEEVDGKHQYKRRKNERTGKLEKIPILNEKGEIIEKEEYVGKFKESSLEAAKSAIANELINDKELNIQINELVRQRLVQSMKKYELYQDEDFRSRFLALYAKLPENKGVCNYDNNAMKRLRPEIDDLTDLYIAKYHQADFDALRSKLSLQERRYRAAYGEGDDNYLKNKLDDLYYRMGNAILRQLKDYDKAIKQTRENQEDSDMGQKIPEPEPEMPEFRFGDDEEFDDEAAGNAGPKEYYLDWKDGYSRARDQIYIDRDYTGATMKLLQLCEKKNVLAIGEMGNVYHFGRGVELDEAMAQAYYTEALDGFTALYATNPKYCAYRIGKQHLYGQGTEKDAEKAAIHLQEAAGKGHSYAMYLMGGLYLQGDGVERNVDTALRYYRSAADQSNPYAQYKLGQIYEQGEIAERDAEKSYTYYEAALAAFLEQKGKDENMLYRIGTMYLRGQGTTVDYEKAAEYLQAAAEQRNDMAMYQLGTLAKRSGDVNSAKEWYAKSAAMGNEYAAAALYRLEKPMQRRDFLSYRRTNDHQLRDALVWLRRSMDDTLEKYLNQRDYEELQGEITEEKESQIEL